MDKEKGLAFISVLIKGDETETYTFLRNFKLNPAVVKDFKGNNAVQISILNNNYHLVEFLIRYIQEYHTIVSISEWINENNIDGLNSIHVAVFKGNFVR